MMHRDYLNNSTLITYIQSRALVWKQGVGNLRCGRLELPSVLLHWHQTKTLTSVVQ